MEKKETQEETINELNKKRRRDKFIKLILLIIIIILLLILFMLINRLGKMGTEETAADVVEITVSDDDFLITKDTELDIFTNFEFEDEKIVAPGSYGDYTFYIKNESEADLTYDLAFEDIMSNPVNMMYKLKFNNVYICGNSEEYVDIENLNIDDIVIKANSADQFTLEWCWIDNDEEDTYTGLLSTEESREYYTLNLSILVN